MSTCPEKELYSVYVDKELPEPWQNTVQTHLTTCSTCLQTERHYQHMHELTQQAYATPEIDFSHSFDKLCKKRSVLEQYTRVKQYRNKSWFNRSLQIPMPAIAAALVLVFCMPVFLFMSGKKGQDLPYRDQFKPIMPISFENSKSDADALKAIAVKQPIYTTDMPLTVQRETPRRARVRFKVKDFARLYGLSTAYMAHQVKMPVTGLKSAYQLNASLPTGHQFIGNEQ